MAIQNNWRYPSYSEEHDELSTRLQKSSPRASGLSSFLSVMLQVMQLEALAVC